MQPPPDKALVSFPGPDCPTGTAGSCSCKMADAANTRPKPMIRFFLTTIYLRCLSVPTSPGATAVFEPPLASAPRNEESLTPSCPRPPRQPCGTRARRQGPGPELRPLDAAARLNALKSVQVRFYLLNAAVTQSLVAGNLCEAEKSARELIALAPQFKGDRNYGNAIQDANLVLGRIAVKAGHTDEAKRLVLEEGKSPGSPQMSGFGPNTSFAQDLLERGRT